MEYYIGINPFVSLVAMPIHFPCNFKILQKKKNKDAKQGEETYTERAYKESVRAISSSVVPRSLMTSLIVGRYMVDVVGGRNAGSATSISTRPLMDSHFWYTTSVVAWW